jgi:hypothetical protein
MDACVAGARVPGTVTACAVGIAGAVLTMAYASSMRLGFAPGASQLAETAGTLAYAMMLSVWNAVRYLCVPPPPLLDSAEGADDDTTSAKHGVREVGVQTDA